MCTYLSVQNCPGGLMVELKHTLLPNPLFFKLFHLLPGHILS